MPPLELTLARATPPLLTMSRSLVEPAMFTAVDGLPTVTVPPMAHTPVLCSTCTKPDEALVTTLVPVREIRPDETPMALESVTVPLLRLVGVRETLSAPEVVTMAKLEELSLPSTMRSRLTVFAPTTTVPASRISPLVVAVYGSWTIVSAMGSYILASVMRTMALRLAMSRRNVVGVTPVLVMLEVLTQPLRKLERIDPAGI